MLRSPVLPEIETLDAVRDHQRITFLCCRVDFPWDTTRALEFALFRTFCVPAISALLGKTQEFGKRAQKRYDDTDIIVSEMMEHGYDSERGRAAIARTNALHGRFKIRNEDFLYVLSTFVFVPRRSVPDGPPAPTLENRSPKLAVTNWRYRRRVARCSGGL